MLQNHVFDNPESEYVYPYTVTGTHAASMYGHDFCLLFLILQNEFLLETNGEEQTFLKDMLVLIRPNDVHDIAICDNLESNCISIAFRMDIVNDLFSYLGKQGEKLKTKIFNSSVPPVCVLTEREKSRVIEKIQHFNELQADQDAEKKIYLRFFIAEIFALFSNNNSHENDKKDEAPFWLTYACDKMCLHENFSEGITRMVELSGKTREYLSRSMQKYKNTTVSAFINELRLTYAANMLINSEQSIVDLCYESGFTSLDYFGKQFKKKYGMAPSKFRLLMKKETV